MDINKKIIEFRKELHKIPEIGLKEIKTSEYIRNKLKSFGYNYESVIGTGIIACKKSDSNEKAIAFRADMDALQIEEKTNVDFSSKHEGMMHACGHDVHMANLLGLAYYLKDKKVKRDVVFIFQPAEESPGGAKLIVEEGILEKYNIGNIFGFHIWPYIDEGKIGVKSGPQMAKTGEIELNIIGKGGHGATPNETVDPVYISSQFISCIQSIISRNIEPLEGGIVTIGYIKGGTVHNIIPDELELGGTIRAFTDDVYNLIKKRIKEICSGFEVVYDVKMQLKITDFYPAVINDEKLTNEFLDLLSDEKIENVKPFMTGEDFSFYQKQVPGVFFFIGSKNKRYTAPLHNAKFNLTDEVVPKAFEVYKKILMRKKIIENK